MTDTKTEMVHDTQKDLSGVAMLVLWPVAIVLWGYCMLALWGWFVVPLWPSAPRVGAAQFVGVRLVAALWTGYRPPDKKVEEAEGFALLRLALVRSFGMPLLILVMGWIVHRFWV